MVYALLLIILEESRGQGVSLTFSEDDTLISLLAEPNLEPAKCRYRRRERLDAQSAPGKIVVFADSKSHTSAHIHSHVQRAN